MCIFQTLSREEEREKAPRQIVVFWTAEGLVADEVTERLVSGVEERLPSLW